MSSKTEKQKNMKEAVKGLFGFSSEEEKLEFEAQQLHLSIMLKIKELMEKKGWNKADLARELGVTKPFVTKLFAAEKFINIKMMAKIEHIFGIRFGISTSTKLIRKKLKTAS
ncbi:MAG TPA: helix-turn-helix transcriptional regulator [bacterium]|nr:helix-turn-helix transcriptional regulator [bacterium]